MLCVRYFSFAQKYHTEALINDMDSMVPAIKWIQAKNYFFPTECDEGIQSKD